MTERKAYQVLALGLLLFVAPAQAQTGTEKDLFWKRIAPLGETLYCALDPVDLRQQPGEYSIEHVYPRSWMAQSLGCGTVAACEGHPVFRSFTSDFHNLWPAAARANSARSNRAFAELPGEQRWGGDELACDLETSGGADDPHLRFEGYVEPREEVRGDIARAMLYVQSKYGALLPEGQQELLEGWAKVDETSEWECFRNAAIEELQGARNRLVDCSP